MKASTKRLGMAAVAGVATMALAAGGTFALFRSSQTSTSHFASGTVTLETVGQQDFDFQNLAPWWGIYWSDHYEWQVAYTGSLDAWVGLDGTLSGDLAACDGGHSFDAWMSSTYYNNWMILHGDGASMANQMVTPVGDWTGIRNITYYLWPTLWPSATDDCQGKKATLQLTAHAVQAYRNTIPGGPWVWDANSISSTNPANVLQDTSNVGSQFLAAHPAGSPSQTKNLSDQPQ